LRAWRAREAKEQGVPAYVICHDSTLVALASRQPTSIAALALVEGMGAKRIERYGEALLRVLHDEDDGD
jgi:ATP-dependent DNA helicase RecQ